MGNLAYIGFTWFGSGGVLLFYAYQILAVALLAAASMTAFQDLQATEWRDVAIGELPEIIVYRNEQGTFTRSVTVAFVLTLIIQFVVKGSLSAAIPFYGVGVFMPIMVMGFAIRSHILKHYTGKKRTWGAIGATTAGVLSGIVFVGQIAGKWTDGGWVVLISFSLLALVANLLLLSPMGYRDPQAIHRIVREKARVQGSMASIVEWQSLKMQEYRYNAYTTLVNLLGMFGVRRLPRFEQPIRPGEFEDALHTDHPEAPSFLDAYLPKPAPTLGGAPKETYHNAAAD